MGYVHVLASFGTAEENTTDIMFLVDTGSYYTIVPPELAETAGIVTTVRTRVRTADNRTVPLETGMAYVKLLGREGAVPVGILDVPTPLLGVTALEGLGLKVNPVDQTVELDRPFGPALLGIRNV
jgi:clan AA aspartic protease